MARLAGQEARGRSAMADRSYRGLVQPCCMVIVAISIVTLLVSLIVLGAHHLPLAHSDREPIPKAMLTPKSGFHSHNDFWRETPIISALAAGCIGIEADVWVYGDELFVGHTRDALAPERTFGAMYIEPLVHLLHDKNMDSVSSAGRSPRGLLDLEPERTVVLLVDVKADPERAWPLLVESLEPLRRRNWLTKFQNGLLVNGPITVVAGGKMSNQPIKVDGTARDIMLDAPLSDLDNAFYNSNNSYWASASFKSSVGLVWKGDLSASQLRRVQRHVQEAHTRGLKVRYWGVPSWPLTLRERIWNTLSREGVDVINADNLQDLERYRPMVQSIA